MNRSDGVMAASSDGPSDTFVKGLELTMPSTSQNSVARISSVRRCSSVSSPVNTFLMVLICHSTTPFIWEAPAGRNCQIMSNFCMDLLSSDSAAVKVVTLSDLMSDGFPRLDINLLMPLMKGSQKGSSSFSM